MERLPGRGVSRAARRRGARSGTTTSTAVRTKVGLAVDQGLRGLGIWALGDDGAHPELWSALRLALGTTTDTKAPTGTRRPGPSLDPALAGQKEQGLPVVSGTVRLTLAADDGPTGSGPAFVACLRPRRRGRRAARERPHASHAGRASTCPLADPAIGGSADTGKRTVYVQWRDVAGNWSRRRVESRSGTSSAPAASPRRRHHRAHPERRRRRRTEMRPTSPLPFAAGMSTLRGWLDRLRRPHRAVHAGAARRAHARGARPARRAVSSWSRRTSRRAQREIAEAPWRADHRRRARRTWSVCARPGVEHAKAIVLTDDDDIGNIHAALTAHNVNPTLHIVLRTFDDEFGRRIESLFPRRRDAVLVRARGAGFHHRDPRPGRRRALDRGARPDAGAAPRGAGRPGRRGAARGRLPDADQAVPAEPGATCCA